MTLKDYICPKRTHSLGINGEGELRGNWLTEVHVEKWPLKWSVCVYFLTYRVENSLQGSCAGLEFKASLEKS